MSKSSPSNNSPFTMTLTSSFFLGEDAVVLSLNLNRGRSVLSRRTNFLPSGERTILHLSLHLPTGKKLKKFLLNLTKEKN